LLRLESCARPIAVLNAAAKLQCYLQFCHILFPHNNVSVVLSEVVLICRSVPIVGTDLINAEPNGPLYLSDGTMGHNTQVCGI